MTTQGVDDKDNIEFGNRTPVVRGRGLGKEKVGVRFQTGMEAKTVSEYWRQIVLMKAVAK